VEALSQWEGFGRFCRRHLGVEPLVLLRGYGLGSDDPAEEVLAVCQGGGACPSLGAGVGAAIWIGECRPRRGRARLSSFTWVGIIPGYGQRL